MHRRSFHCLGRFLKKRGGKLLTASVLVGILPGFVEFQNYAHAIEVDRRHAERLVEIAKNLKIDAEFLRHPGEKGSKSRFEGLVASLGGRVRSLFALAPPKPASTAATNITQAIQDTKSRYAIVAADTGLARIAHLVEVSLAPSEFTGKHKGQIKAEIDSVLRLLEKDFLPALPDNLPSVARARDARMRGAVTDLRSTAKAILKGPHALDDSNLATTLTQLKTAVTAVLAVRKATTRWTRDPFPVKDVTRQAATRTFSPGPGAAASSAVVPTGGAHRAQAIKGLVAPPAEIQALATSLGTAAKIFAFVHDQIDWEAYSGVAKGTLGALKEGSGNDWDQALLLRDLLAAAGYQADLEWGTVTLPIAQAMNLVGTEDPLQTANLLATAGFDALALTSAGVPVAVQFTHVWVRAFLPYVKDRGARPGAPDTWVRMDPSFKRYQYDAGIPINGRVAWSEDDYLLHATLTSPADFYGDKIWSYIRANNIVCQNLSQVAKTRTVIKENFPYVPATLTARIERVLGQASSAPSDQSQSVALTLTDTGGNTVASYTASLADLWGKKLSLTFPPASPDDAAIIQSYGGLFSTPAYLVQLRPVFSLDDQSVAQGNAVPAGAAFQLALAFTQPNVPLDTVRHDVTAGETHVEVFDAGRAPASLFQARTTRLGQLVGSNASEDAILSERLFLIGLRYFQETDDGVAFAAGVRWQRPVKRVFEAAVRRQVNVTYNVAGAPIRLAASGNNIDASRLQVGVIPIQNDLSNRREALSLAGFQSSYLEASIWEELESQKGISAVKALLLSRMAGQTLRTADSGNVDAVLAQVNFAPDVESEIRGAVLQGRVAKLATSDISLNRFSGTGYVLEDPATGAATFPISGNTAGGGDTGGGTGAGPETLGSESWLEGPLGELLRELLAFLGGGGGDGGGGPATNQSDPVNLSSGNMYRTFADLTIVARGIPVALSRTYNSRSTYNGPFGYGWTFNYGEVLVTNADGSITYREADGTEHLFTKNPDGTFNSPAGKHLDLVSSGPSYTMRSKDGFAQGFDSRGLLVSQSDLNGNSVTINRDAQGNVTTVLDASGRTALTFTMAGGKTTQVTDLSGRSVLYAYTGDDLTRVTDTAGKSWTFSYDLSHNLSQLTDPLGNSQSYDYDTDDRLFHHVDATGAEEFFHYDIAHGQSTLTDRRGGDRLIQFDATGRATLEADPAGNVVTSTWDADNNRAQTVDSRDYTTLYEYDAKGNTTKQTNPDGGVVTTTYDVSSRPLNSTDALGVRTTNVYDGRGNLLTSTRNVSGQDEVTTNTYDSSGQLLTTKDPNGGVTAMTWNGNGTLTSRTDAASNTTMMTPDGLGRITSIRDPGGNTTSIVYDARDRMTSLTDPFTNVTTFVYDGAGRRTSVTTPRGTTSYSYDNEGRVLVVTDPLSNKLTTTYSPAGDVLTRTDPRGNVTSYQYDASGRAQTTTDANGGVTTYAYCAALGGGASCSTCGGGGGGGSFCDLIDPKGNRIHQDFDVMGRVVAITDALSHTMTMQYDKNGRKTLDTDAAGNANRYGYDEAGRLLTVTEATGSVTSYGYDKNGNKISQKDANGHVWAFAYDALNRLLSETDPLGRVTSYTYDSLGNLKTKTDGNAKTTTYSYNVRRPTGVAYADGSGETYTYDTIGRRTGMSNANGSFTFTYDTLNRILTSFNQRNNVTLTYAYDQAGNRKKLTTPKGDVAYTYDARNRLTAIADPIFGSFSLQYDAMDRRTQLTNPNGTKTAYQYDNAYRLTALATTDAGGTVLDAWSYQYDAVGNRTSKTDLNGRAETYQYDNLYRLTQATYTDGSQEKFTYDKVGNRLTKTDQVGVSITYSYDVANQLLTAGSDAFTHDGNGSVVRKVNTAGTTNYAYDLKNRLTNITGPEGFETNLYDAADRRMDMNGTVFGPGQLRFEYDQTGNPIIDLLPNNSVWIYRVYGPGIDEPLAEWRNDGTPIKYLHHDALGSVTAATSTTGQVLYRQSYKAFGERTISGQTGGVVPARLSYTSRENGLGSLYQYRSRYYDAGAGRFLGQDAYRGNASTPPSLQRYVYVFNNPINYVDPSGLSGRYAFFLALVAAFILGVGGGAPGIRGLIRVAIFMLGLLAAADCIKKAAHDPTAFHSQECLAHLATILFAAAGASGTRAQHYLIWLAFAWLTLDLIELLIGNDIGVGEFVFLFFTLGFAALVFESGVEQLPGLVVSPTARILWGIFALGALTLFNEFSRVFVNVWNEPDYTMP